MKIAFFVGSLERGGTETLILDVVRNRADAPFDCVLLYRNEGNLSDDYRSTGVPMIRIKPRGLKIGYIARLRRVLRYEGVDILHTQTLLNSLLGLFCVCFSHIKLVASFHGFFLSLKGRIFTHLVMWFSDASVFVSDYVRKWYLQQTMFAPTKRCHVVYNGIDFSKIDKHYPTPDFLDKCVHFSLTKQTIVAMVGSFVSGRSQLFLCKCIKRMQDEGIKGFHFFFIGNKSKAEPNLFDECVTYCQENELCDRVHFVGGRNDVPAILQHLDGFVYASNNDTFGIAVVEALASGTPVIVNDWDVMKEITNNGRIACLYKTQDIDDCVNKLKHFLCDISGYKLSAMTSMHIIRDKYSIGKHIQDLYSLYSTLV